MDPNSHFIEKSVWGQMAASLNGCTEKWNKIFVCAKCFAEIENIDIKHRICKKCEIEAEEKVARRKAQAKKIASKGVAIVGTTIMVGVNAFTSESSKLVRKRAAAVGDMYPLYWTNQ